MKIVCLIIAFTLLLSPSWAMWAHVSTEELLEETDVVLIATLESVSEWTENDVDYSAGLLSVRKIVAGTAKTSTGNPLAEGDVIKIRWQNSSMIACPRVEFSQYEQQTGIWLLNIHFDGTVQADYPGRRMEEHELPTLVDLIRRKKFKRSVPKLVNLVQDADVTPELTIPDSPFDSDPKKESDRSDSWSNLDRYALLRATLVFGFFLSLFCFLYRGRLIQMLRKLWPI